MRHWIHFMLLAMLPFSAQAFELKVEPVADNTYAIVGHIGPRTPENHALNNTLGFVITDNGVVLVSSGATPGGAQLIEEAIATVTSKPVILVVNIGVQDHHWLGNSYFADKGVPIKALKRTVDSQKQQVTNHLTRLQQQLGTETGTISPVYANDVIDADRQQFNLGGVSFELIWPGNGHFIGDTVLWLPKTQTVFTGDFVFHDRMLGIHPATPVADWRHSFHKIAALNPRHIIPGHGHAGNMNKTKHDTGNYLDWLILEVGKALEEWQELGDTVKKLGDAPAFSHLSFYDSWHKRNIHQTYMQLEASQ